MEVGVVVWVKGKGTNVGWLEGTLVAKVSNLHFSIYFSLINFFRVTQTSQFVSMKLVKTSHSRK
jgi:hypothetical protein